MEAERANLETGCTKTDSDLSFQLEILRTIRKRGEDFLLE
jgi:hypothetical protein